MRVQLKKWALRLLGLDEMLNNLIEENNNLKRRLREMEGLSNFQRRF